MRLRLLLVLIPLFVAVGVHAQERIVTGKVTSTEEGTPLPGVNVSVKGTSNGTATDAEGNYSIRVAGANSILVFSFIGLKTEEITVGERSVIDIGLALDATQLNEVVVTALGIKREVKSLPFAAQQINSDKLNMTRANNVNDGLAGKVSGIQVRGQAGSALGRNSTIRIRGASSLEDGAPLYVLDGTPVNSQDINPDDIESVNVLKGPAATAMYGQRGDHGVIIMTSKKGTRGAGLGINVTQNTYAEKVYILPRQQNSYAGGAFPDLVKFNWQPGMPDGWKALDGKYYPDYTDDGSWGPRMVGQEYIPWYAWAPGTKYSFKTAKLTPQPNNIRDFYRTGVNSITNVSVSKSQDNYSYRVSYTNQTQTGILPNTNLKKNTFSTQTSIDLGKIFTVAANINYVDQFLHGEFDDGYSNQTSGSFNQWFHRDLNMNILNELSGLKSPEGRFVSWNHFNPDYYVQDSNNDGVINGDLFYRGYYWYGHKTYMENINQNDHRTRLFGDISITAKLSDKISVQGIYQKNQVVSYGETKRPSILPYSFNTELRPTNEPQWDYYGTGQSFAKEDNLQFLVSYNDRLANDKITVSANAGGNLRMEKGTQISANTINGLVVPNLYTLSNSKTSPFAYSNLRSRKEVRSLYARASVGYKDLIFLDGSLRNDWSSALPSSNNSYLYGSLGTSFVFSELTSSALPFLSFGKIRLSAAKVGSDLPAYSTSLLYGLGTTPWNGNVTMTTPNTLIDPHIQPSLSTSYEGGLDLKFFENRIELGVTYYKQIRTKEILSVDVSGASGFTQKLINAGKLESSGIELQLDAHIIKRKSFSWDVSYNMAHNTSKVVSLVPGVDAVAQGNGTLTDAAQTATVYNIAGARWGQLRGFGIKKVNGKPVLDDNGFYVPVQNQNLGSILPAFTGGIQNAFSYKNFNLSVNIDFQKGGKFFSLSDWYGTFSGLTERTARLNDRGVPERTAVADGGGVHVKGVNAAGEAKDHYVEAKLYYQQFANNGIAENSIYDLTYVKLREVNLQYNIPVSRLGSFFKIVRTASVSVVGRNLWMIYSSCKDYDPSIISGTFGENGQLPGTRQLGFQVKLGF